MSREPSRAADVLAGRGFTVGIAVIASHRCVNGKETNVLVHTILEDLGPLTDTPAYVHTTAFVDLDAAREYITECAEETISETENPALILRHDDRKVEIIHNGEWVGVFEINTVEVQ